MVHPSGLEPKSSAPEANVLSIELWVQDRMVVYEPVALRAQEKNGRQQLSLLIIAQNLLQALQYGISGWNKQETIAGQLLIGTHQQIARKSSLVQQ
jgi:hypothetical protein